MIWLKTLKLCLQSYCSTCGNQKPVSCTMICDLDHDWSSEYLQWNTSLGIELTFSCAMSFCHCCNECGAFTFVSYMLDGEVKGTSADIILSKLFQISYKTIWKYHMTMSDILDIWYFFCCIPIVSEVDVSPKKKKKQDGHKSCSCACFVIVFLQQSTIVD